MQPQRWMSQAFLTLWMVLSVPVLPAVDCNLNGIEDFQDLASGTSDDCDGNGVPDECDLRNSLQLGSSRAIPLGDEPEAWIVGDLDGDRDEDLVVSDGRSIHFYLQGVGGRLELWDLWEMPGVQALGLVDLDGDLDLDLVIGDRLSILVARNQGGAELSSVVEVEGLPVPGSEYDEIIPLDLDSDGDLDLLVREDGNNILHLENDGAGSLTLRSNILEGFSSTLSKPALADFDGDGNEDLVLLDGNLDTLFWFRSRGDGTFDIQEGPELRGLRSGVSSLQAGDVDGDGKPDLLLTSFPEVHILLNSGEGPFGESGVVEMSVHSRLLLEDIDRDGRVDFLGLGVRELMVAWEMGTAGNYEIESRFTGGSFSEMIPIRTGEEDLPALLVSSPGFAGLWIIEIRDDGQPVAPAVQLASQATALVPLDYDADGDLDLVTAAHSNRILTYNNEEGQLQPPNFIRLYRGSRGDGLVTADFDGDGIQDLAMTLWSDGETLGKVAIGCGQANPESEEERFLPCGLYEMGGRPSRITTGDFDADGHPDLAIAISSGFEVSLLFNQGDGTFESGEDLELESGSSGLQAGDLDNDGDDDLIVIENRGGSSGRMKVWHSLGDRTFEGPDVYGTQDSPRDLVLADLDRDGHRDVVVVSGSDHWLTIYHNLGGGKFPRIREAQNVRVDHVESTSLAVSDLDGNGTPEILISSVSEEALVVLQADEQGQYRVTDHYLAGGQAVELATLDLDGDGWEEIVISNFNAGRLAIVANESALPRAYDDDGSGVPDLCEGPVFLRGDANADGSLNISDAIFVIQVTYRGVTDVACRASGDANDDGRVDNSDIVTILQYLFLARPLTLPPPSSRCGLDPTPDDLSCESFPPCGFTGI